MTKGVLLHAFGNDQIDYYKLATVAAKLVKKYLKLPVVCITDRLNTVPEFDYIIEAQSAINQIRNLDNISYLYKNDTRVFSYDLSPFDQTLLIDSDYLIFNSELLKWFETDYNFVCPWQTHYPGTQSRTSYIFNGLPQAWATVIYFNKSKEAKAIFEHWWMIQENYNYYRNLLNVHGVYRNDYSLSLAMHTMNGYKLPTIKMSSLLTIPSHVRIIDFKDDNTVVVNKNDKLVRIKATNIHVMGKLDLLTEPIWSKLNHVAF